MTPQEVANAAKLTKASSIILLGGEALCMGVDFYLELLKLTTASLDFTTNLKAFYQNPDEWSPLFRDERVSVCTSFNYGTSRLYSPKQVYNEQMFIKTMRLFKSRVGYTPMFIAVIDKNNVHLWRQHIELAKKLGTRCRLNNALKLGRQGEYFPRSEMFKIWIQIAKEKLDKYELNTYERMIGRCPINSCQLCASTIRVVQKNNKGQIVYYNCDDRSSMGCETLPVSDVPSRPHKSNPTPMFVKCYTCRLFNICNGCKTNIMQIKDKEKYCYDMKQMEHDIVNLRWRLQ